MILTNNFPMANANSLLLIFCSIFVVPLILGVNSKEEAVFKDVPQNSSVLIGTTVLLQCSISSAPNPQIFHQWRTNKNLLLGYHESGVLPGYGGHYSYVEETPNELHLRVENVTLEDDGVYECQWLFRPPLRAAARVEVLVPPTQVQFKNYVSESDVEIDEGQSLNLTCICPRAKPEPEINLFLNGKKVSESSHLTSTRNEDGTLATSNFILLKPSKDDHGKRLSCEALHKKTDVTLRDFITLNILYSSDRPKIDVVDGIEDQKFKAGQNITLLCSTVGGNPPPTLVWSNQEGPIESTLRSFVYDPANKITKNVLTFIAKGSDNENVYKCSSSNRVNAPTLHSTVTIHVDYPPETVYIFGQTAVRRGEPVPISCQTGVSSPPSRITWKVNGEPFPTQIQSEKRQVQGVVTESNITVDTSTFAPSLGQVSVECIAENDQGLPASKLHIIRVLSPPVHPFIHELNQNTVFLQGQILNLTCEAQGGNPLATLGWFRGLEKVKDTYNSNYGNASRSVVSLRLDRTMNQQRIRCEAESPALDLPLNVETTVSVYFPPNNLRIMPLESDQREGMVAHRPTRLVCLTDSSNPPAEISWEFEGGNETGGKAVRLPGHFTKKPQRPNAEFHGYKLENTVMFTPTEGMDGAVVRCIAGSPQWPESVSSHNYTLRILYAPRIAVTEPFSSVISEGESFEEKLSISANPPSDSYQWRKNGVHFERSIGSIFVRGPNPVVIGAYGVAKEDAGTYSLRVSNRIGAANISLRLTVTYSARVVYVSTPIIASVGEEVVLECEADGFPLRPGMVKWLRGHSEVESVVKDQKRAVLRLNASHENKGAYQCVADNGIGAPNYTTAYVLVRQSPQLIGGSAYQRAAGPLGGKATLKCRAMAVPNAEFAWSIDGEGHLIAHNTTKYRFWETQLDHTTFQSTLTIAELEERDYQKRYRCRVSNRHGMDQMFVSLESPTRPDVPQELEVLNVTDTAVTLGWSPGFDGGSEQMFEIVYRESDGDEKIFSANTSNTRVTIEGLDTAQTYTVRVRALNQRFSSDYSPPLAFHTLDENLRNVYDTSKQSGSITRSTLFWACLALPCLFIFNCLLICFLHRRHRKRKGKDPDKAYFLPESNEMKSTLNPNNNNSNGGVPNKLPAQIQIYGATNSASALIQRPISSATNKSEMNDRTATNSEDNQSSRTVIEVAPYSNLNGDFFYDSTCLVDYDASLPNDISQDQYTYSQIQKPLGGTYRSLPKPEPPVNSSAAFMLQYPHHQQLQQHVPSPSQPPQHSALMGYDAEEYVADQQPLYYNGDNNNGGGEGTVIECYGNGGGGYYFHQPSILNANNAPGLRQSSNGGGFSESGGSAIVGTEYGNNSLTRAQSRKLSTFSAESPRELQQQQQQLEWPSNGGDGAMYGLNGGRRFEGDLV